jgi:hypothetical protein
MWNELVRASAIGDTNKFNELFREILKRQMPNIPATQAGKSFSTDKDGRFRVTGIGADRVVFNVQVTGARVGGDQFSIVTSSETGTRIPRGKAPFRAEFRTYPATFDHVMKPARSVAGTVRDRATGKPLVGIQVAAWGPAYVESFTDEEGKYELVGLSKVTEHTVTFWPFNVLKAQPYLNATLRLHDKPGLAPLTGDVGLVRGIVLRGRLTEKGTGKPVIGAMVWYATFKDNPHVASFAFPGNPKFQGDRNFFDAPQLQQTRTRTRGDGEFEMVVLPGRGLLGTRVMDGPYVSVDLSEARKDPYYWGKTVPLIANSSRDFQAVKLIDVPENAEKTTCDLTVERGRSLAGRIFDPEGKPVAGVMVTGLGVETLQSKGPLSTAAFEVQGLAPGRTRVLGFYLAERQLGALVRAHAEDKGPLSVKLQKCGAFTGRLIASDREPRRGIRLRGFLAERDRDTVEGRGRDLSALTGEDGRFQIEGVVPEVKYDLRAPEGPANRNGVLLARGVQVGPNERKDLGDVPVKFAR